MLNILLVSSKSQLSKVVDRIDGEITKTGNNSGSGSNRKFFQSRKTSSNIKVTEEPNFPTPEARLAFNLLRQIYTKVLIFQHVDPECHILIQTNASGYAISDVLN